MLKKFMFNVIKKKKEKFPELLSIELTSVCNAKCIMCPHDTMTRVKQNMTFDTLKKVVENCKGKPLKKINLFWFGDSLCNPEAIPMIRYIRKELPKVRLYLSTNAQLLKKEHSLALLEEQLIDVVNFDIDGATKETFESVRINLNFEKVVKNTLFFLNYKKEKGYKKPQTRVTIINMEPTKDEVDDFVGFWKDKADKVDVNQYNTWLGSQEDRNIGDSLERSQTSSFTFACNHPWSELVISSDGIAGLCCLDYELTAPLGKLEDETIEEIWQGKVLNSYREKMLNNKYSEIGACKKCNAYIYQENSTWAKLQK